MLLQNDQFQSTRRRRAHLAVRPPRPAPRTAGLTPSSRPLLTRPSANAQVDRLAPEHADADELGTCARHVELSHDVRSVTSAVRTEIESRPAISRFV